MHHNSPRNIPQHVVLWYFHDPLEVIDAVIFHQKKSPADTTFLGLSNYMFKYCIARLHPMIMALCLDQLLNCRTE